MKNILLQWTYYADIVCVPDNIAENLSFYQLEFDKWLSNKNSKHNYWVKVILENEDTGEGLSFDSDAFILWLNDFTIDNDNEKAYYIAEHIQPNIEQKRIPTIFF